MCIFHVRLVISHDRTRCSLFNPMQSRYIAVTFVSISTVITWLAPYNRVTHYRVILHRSTPPAIVVRY